MVDYSRALLGRAAGQGMDAAGCCAPQCIRAKQAAVRGRRPRPPVHGPRWPE
jgi:hypothetical protein